MKNSRKNEQIKSDEYAPLDLSWLKELQKRAEMRLEEALDDAENAALESSTLEAAIEIRNNDAYQGFSLPYDHLSLLEHQKLFIDECNRTLNCFKELLG